MRDVVLEVVVSVGVVVVVVLDGVVVVLDEVVLVSGVVTVVEVLGVVLVVEDVVLLGVVAVSRVVLVVVLAVWSRLQPETVKPATIAMMAETAVVDFLRFMSPISFGSWSLGCVGFACRAGRGRAVARGLALLPLARRALLALPTGPAAIRRALRVVGLVARLVADVVLPVAVDLPRFVVRVLRLRH